MITRVMTYDIVQSLWVGSRLGAMEQLAIQSFLQHGHEFHLYVYGTVEGPPAGTTLKDASRILPSDSIFTYQRGNAKGSYAGFSNFFRYKLLHEHGGWWVDTDVVCLRPFEFQREYVFATEVLDEAGETGIASAVMKVPPGSHIMRSAWETCQQKDVAALEFGGIGPFLMTREVADHRFEEFVEPPSTFCPVNWFHWRRMTDPGSRWDLPPSVHSIHLWKDMWRRNRVDTDAAYDESCLYERLKQRFLREPTTATPPRPGRFGE